MGRGSGLRNNLSRGEPKWSDNTVPLRQGSYAFVEGPWLCVTRLIVQSGLAP
jgi:hypothetical protein